MRVSYPEIFNWVNHDALLMMTSHSLRNFSRNLLTVLMAIYLDEIGFSLIQIGAFISAGIMGSALYTVLVAFFADLAGRRLILVVLTLLRATVGLSLVIMDNAPFLILLSFFGAHSTGGAGGAVGGRGAAAFEGGLRDAQRRPPRGGQGHRAEALEAPLRRRPDRGGGSGRETRQEECWLD